MPDPTFTAPPTAPARSDAPATFVTRADAFIGWFATLYTELVAFVTWTNTQVSTIATAVSTGIATLTALAGTAGFTGTSTSSVAIGTGSKSFTTQTSRAFVVGTYVTVAETAAPTTNLMYGQVTAYNSGTGALTVNVTVTAGSGTIAAWTISLAGPAGPAATVPKASAADIQVGAEDAEYTTPKGLMDAFAFVAASVSGSYTLDLSTGYNFELTLTGNLTFAVPSNLKDGKSGVITFIQDGTGSRTLSLNASIKKAGAAPTLSTAAGAVNRFGYIVRGSVFELTSMETIS